MTAEQAFWIVALLAFAWWLGRKIEDARRVYRRCKDQRDTYLGDE